MSWAHYLLQANLYLIVFFVFYKALLEGETYFKLNRYYLIAAGIFSLIIPFIRLEWFFKQPVTQKLSAGVGQLTILISGGGNETVSDAINWGNIIVFVYISGVLFFLGRLMFQLASIKKIFRRINPGSAFTFFSKKSVDPSLPEQATINAHEHIHIAQFHTADILFFEFIGIITWFNPVIYFYKHAVKNIHEYLADDAAAEFIGDKEAYAMLLLSKAFGVNPSAITNSFFNKSLIKKRILMLHKEKSRKRAVLKYGLFVPLFSAMLILSSATLRKNEGILDISKQIPLNNPIQAVKEVLAVDSTIAPAQRLLGLNTMKHSVAVSQVRPSKSTLNVQEYNSRLDEAPVDSTSDAIHDFAGIDIPPAFPGGMRKFYAYVAKSIKYPREAVENNVEGKVILSFTIERNGGVSDIHIDRKVGSGLDEEAVRVLEESPAWTPGLLKDQPVRVRYNIPISFVLNQQQAPAKKADAVEKLTLTSTSTLSRLHTSHVGGNSDTPMYFIDGEKSTPDAIASINKNKIESISIMKDQSAIMLYGPSAKKGVILIVMKKAENAEKDPWLK